MDELKDYPIKWSKPDKDSYHIISLICEIQGKKRYKCTYLQNRNKPTDTENRQFPKGKRVGEG